MKKVILSLSLLVGISASASAQASFGVKAGASLTTLTGSGSENVANKIGFNGGLLANVRFGDALAIQPEVLFSMKGSQFKDDSKYKTNLSYIDIPVLLQYNADGLFFEAGPQLGILASAKFTNGDESEDIKKGIETIDFGYAVGLGYKLESGPMFGLRYNGGITNINKETDKVRNSAFQLYAGFMFGGK
ncbi:PorT family protein [Hymenobacter sp. BT664]|uniref:PorT family protein n=1 Tax=Hymenobacter montanus TaxID=2771359 RepID=A0A927BEU5_9BACT|nr:porin family protein [Hymenobacter montanus]MBD2768737.1 PorT family protein [Hymenobacter montanus]